MSATHRIVDEAKFRKAASYAVFIEEHTKVMREAHALLDSCNIPRRKSDGKIMTLSDRINEMKRRYSAMYKVFAYAKKHMAAIQGLCANDLLARAANIANSKLHILRSVD